MNRKTFTLVINLDKSLPVKLVIEIVGEYVGEKYH